MENPLLNYFILNNELRNTCDFNSYVLNEGSLVYEVIRIIDSKPLFFEEHIERFYHSAKLSNLNLQLSKHSILLRIKSLIEANGMKTGNIEFLVHFDNKGYKRFMAWVSPFYYPSQEQYLVGVPVGIMQAIRKQPNAKAFNRKLRENADEIIKTKNVYEVILENHHGFLTEGSRSNIFFIKNNTLITPPVSSVLPGITRLKIMKMSENLNINVKESNIPTSKLKDFDCCFLTGTSPKILPVQSVEKINFEVDNDLMRKLMNRFDLVIEKYISKKT